MCECSSPYEHLKNCLELEAKIRRNIFREPVRFYITRENGCEEQVSRDEFIRFVDSQKDGKYT